MLLGVKSWQVATAAEATAPLIGPDTAVVPLQNGVEAPETVARVLGRRHALGGTCKVIARVAEPGRIVDVGLERLTTEDERSRFLSGYAQRRGLDDAGDAFLRRVEQLRERIAPDETRRLPPARD